MNRHVGIAFAYLRHIWKAQSRYRIHSPFVYEFYSNVIGNTKEYSQFRGVNRLRKELEATYRFIKRKDMGALCKEFPSDQRFVRVRDIARKSAISRKKGETIFKLVTWMQPKTILELGTSLGISTTYLALACPTCRIITLEGCIDSANIARENFEKGNQKNVEVITGEFSETLPLALGKLEHTDIIFFDGNHRKEATLQYFELCMQHVTSTSVLIFDDIHWSKGMEEAWEIVKQDSRVKVTIDLFHLGVVFLKEELSKEDFILRN